MRFTILTILATAASLVAAQEVPDTTTLTSTTTRVIILTECNPTVTDCPYRTTTSTEVILETTTSEEPTTSTYEAPTTTSVYVPPTTTSIELPPVVNTTTSSTRSSTKVYQTPTIKTTFYPAGNSTTEINVPGTDAPSTDTIVNPQPTEEGSSPSTPVAVPTGAASGLAAQSGIVGVAVMAALFALY